MQGYRFFTKGLAVKVILLFHGVGINFTFAQQTIKPSSTSKRGE